MRKIAIAILMMLSAGCAILERIDWDKAWRMNMEYRATQPRIIVIERR
jgi:hypothetical protein